MYGIYLNSQKDCLLVEELSTNKILSLKEMGVAFYKKAENSIKENYPECFSKLEEIHGSGPEKTFARVRNFFFCNFSGKNCHSNIDEDWNFTLDNVPCPAKTLGHCTLGICHPEMKNSLSEREVEVLRLFAKGFDEAEIADALFISKHTVHNHINNMYRKTGVAGKSSPDRKLVNYAHTKRII